MNIEFKYVNRCKVCVNCLYWFYNKIEYKALNLEKFFASIHSNADYCMFILKMAKLLCELSLILIKTKFKTKSGKESIFVLDKEISVEIFQLNFLKEITWFGRPRGTN